MNKLSIVCATHNNINNLINTIKNILESNQIPDEFIICSTDSNDYKKLLNIFRKSINLVFIKSKIKSQTYQRSLAIKKAKNELILQIDDDVIIFPKAINYMQKYFDNIDKKIIVGGYLIYPNNEHVSKRFTKYYKSSSLLKLIYYGLNLFNKPNQMSILKSGRIFPLMEDTNKNKEWLSSFLMYTKKTYYLSDVHFNLGKGYYEDIIFTHKLYKLGYELVMEKKSKVKIDYNLSTGITSYFKSLPMQYYFVKSFKKNIFLFIIDIFIFSFIHFFISIKKIYD